MTIQYDPAIIDPGLADLEGRNANLRATNEEVKAASDRLIAVWDGEAKNAFVNAKLRWDNEFETLAAKLAKLISTSHQAKDAALAADAQSAAGFHG